MSADGPIGGEPLNDRMRITHGPAVVRMRTTGGSMAGKGSRPHGQGGNSGAHREQVEQAAREYWDDPANYGKIPPRRPKHPLLSEYFHSAQYSKNANLSPAMRDILKNKAGLEHRLRRTEEGRWQLTRGGRKPAQKIIDGAYIGRDRTVQGITMPTADSRPSTPVASGHEQQLPWAQGQYNDLSAELWQNRRTGEGVWKTQTGQVAWEAQTNQEPQNPMAGSSAAQLAEQLTQSLTEGDYGLSSHVRGESLSALGSGAVAVPEVGAELDWQAVSGHVVPGHMEFAETDVPLWATSYPDVPYQPADFEPGPFQPGPFQPDPFQPDPFQTAPYQTDFFQADPFQMPPLQADSSQADPFQADPFQADLHQATSVQTTPFQADPFQSAPIQASPTYRALPDVGANTSLGQAVRGNLPPGGWPAEVTSAAQKSAVPGVLPQQRMALARQQQAKGGPAR